MLPRELIAKIRLIEIHASRIVDTQLAGPYHSVFKGRGIAFSEVRPYYPGDDVRVIDWNVSARMHEPHIKLFTEERDRTVMLIIDMSASGLFGSLAQSKREIMAEVAALVAFSAIKNQDRVGLIVVTDQVEHALPPRRGRRHALHVIRAILTHQPRSPRTSLRAALEYLDRVCRHRAVVFVISDFLDTGWERPMRIARRRHDVVAVAVSDPMEAALPRLGLVTFEDAETGEVVEIDTAGPEAHAYAAQVAARRTQQSEWLRRSEIDEVEVQTDRPYVDALVRFFRARARRARHR